MRLGCAFWSAQADGTGGGVGFDVADAQVPAADAQLRRDAQTFTREENDRLAAGLRSHFDVGPGDSAAPTGAKHFQHRFFGRETPGKMFVIPLVIARAILLLERRENAIEKMLAVIVNHFSDPACFNDIDPVTENGHEMKVRV